MSEKTRLINKGLEERTSSHHINMSTDPTTEELESQQHFASTFLAANAIIKQWRGKNQKIRMCPFFLRQILAYAPRSKYNKNLTAKFPLV